MAPLLLEVDVVAQTAILFEFDAGSLPGLAEFVLAAEQMHGPWSIAIALVSDDMLRAMHRDFMGIDTETDVMTFPGEIDSSGARGGDIVVSVDRAAEQAADVGHRAWDEIRFLIVHGLLHLCGWNDASEPERWLMLERQQDLIERFDALPR